MKKLFLICASVIVLNSPFALSSEVKPMLVTDGNLNSETATDIYFGESDENYCTLSLNTKSVTQGIPTKSKSKNNKNIAIECNWDGAYYVQSSKHPTAVTALFTTLDSSLKSATLEISIKLINTKGYKSFFSLDNKKLLITGEMFEGL